MLKKIIILLICFFCLSACSKINDGEKNNSMNKAEQEKYFDYFFLHNDELRYLPNFKNASEIKGDDSLLLFAFVNRSEKDSLLFSYEDFNFVCKKYFGKIFTIENSIMFNKTDVGFEPAGFDLNDQCYYRLNTLSKNADGSYSAFIEGIVIGECDLWDDEEFRSKNGQIIYDMIKEKGITEEEAVLQVFKSVSYKQTFDINLKINLTFKESETNGAIIYLSSKNEGKDID